MKKKEVSRSENNETHSKRGSACLLIRVSKQALPAKAAHQRKAPSRVPIIAYQNLYKLKIILPGEKNEKEFARSV